MALHRKFDALMALRPDLAVISEAAEPGRLLDRAPALAEASLVWVGRNPHKGLLLAGFGTTRLEFNRRRHDGGLHWMAPVAVSTSPMSSALPGMPVSTIAASPRWTST